MLNKLIREEEIERRSMMGFSGALQWWDEWHLRVLALGSLFIQYFLFVSGTVRRRALPAWLRLFIWLAYLGGDALAIYALATLFNRRSQLPGDGSGSGLEVVWAPVLLVHLGGQHNMTAYSIQDTELWMRHAITVASQVSVALYVFCKLWSGEKGLLQAAILMFVFGIIRSCQKPWALKSASISAIASSSATLVPSSPSALRKQGMVALFWQVCTCGYGYGFQSTGFLEAVAEEKDILPQEFAKEARKCVLESELAHDQDKAELLAEPSVEMYVNMVLGDIPVPYSTRIKILQRFMALDFPHAYHLSDCMFLLSFLLLYTRKTILISRLGLCLHLLLPFLALASVVILFSTGHKYLGYKYNMTDVKVTYILFSCTALLDFLMLLVSRFITFIPPVKVAQHSLLSCASRNKRPTILMKLATVVCCKDYVNMHCYIEQAPETSTAYIVHLVHGYVKDGWKQHIHNADSYRRFNSRGGHWTLRKRRLRRLRWSLNMAFDRSVLLWHIATELCYGSTTNRIPECVQGSMVISNYMAYLLCIHPEMLMPGTRSSIFTFACHDVELMLGHESSLGDLVPNAHRLHYQLLELHDEGERWEVVQGVWVEMLCYSASRCRGYLHAKSLSEGVELLSRVWLLLLFMGMETFADRFQRPFTRREVHDDDAGRTDENEINISIV
ncbi:uncharacterized protein [Aegilops tauschii subsp. strangulata]|uniref:DUF4220 domain-containing protein n=1 Tax=Aegilops tauschii subsp. strangulata TaxID=200361 RepID=A0A453JDB0_AEGTS|nr:uncharacterized protein LOC109783071 [Aegilops tauschii subsp. strangulata]